MTRKISGSIAVAGVTTMCLAPDDHGALAAFDVEAQNVPETVAIGDQVLLSVVRITSANRHLKRPEPVAYEVTSVHRVSSTSWTRLGLKKPEPAAAEEPDHDPSVGVVEGRRDEDPLGDEAL